MTDDRPAASIRPTIPPETLVEAQRLWETTEFNQSEIARRVGIQRLALRRRALAGGWLRPQETARREALLRNVRGKVDKEIAAADRLFGHDADFAGDDAAKAARNLTSLVKALRELAKYDQEQGRGALREDADDACPDLDQFRRDLAERLAKLQSGNA